MPASIHKHTRSHIRRNHQSFDLPQARLTSADWIVCPHCKGTAIELWYIKQLFTVAESWPGFLRLTRSATGFIVPNLRVRRVLSIEKYIRREHSWTSSRCLLHIFEIDWWLCCCNPVLIGYLPTWTLRAYYLRVMASIASYRQFHTAKRTSLDQVSICLQKFVIDQSANTALIYLKWSGPTGREANKSRLSYLRRQQQPDIHDGGERFRRWWINKRNFDV